MKKPEVSREKYESLKSDYKNLEARHNEGGVVIRETLAELQEMREKYERQREMEQNLMDEHVKLESKYENLERKYKSLFENYENLIASKEAMGYEISQQRRDLNAAVEDQNKQLKIVRRIAQAISTMDDMEQVRMISLLNANQSVCNIVRTLQHENGSIAYSLRVERLLGE